MRARGDGTPAQACARANIHVRAVAPPTPSTIAAPAPPSHPCAHLVHPRDLRLHSHKRASLAPRAPAR